MIVASIGAYDPFQTIGHYSVTKTALLGMGKVLAKELRTDGIRVNIVAPGLIKTDFSGMLWKHGEEKTIKYMQVNRLGEPRDVANTVKFLLSDEASYITG